MPQEEEEVSCTDATDARIYITHDITPFTCEPVNTYDCSTTKGEDIVGSETVPTCYLDGLCPSTAPFITMASAPTDWYQAFVGTCELACPEGNLVYTGFGFLLCLDCKPIIERI